MALVVLLVPLSGCIGDDDTAPAPTIGTEDEIEKGVPPQKFTFEPAKWLPTGEAKREKRVEESQLPVIGQAREYWRLSWKVDGIPPIGGDDGAGELVYNVWVGRKTGDNIGWEQVVNAAATASNGSLEGATSWEGRYGSYIGVMISLETANDQNLEVPILSTTEISSEDTPVQMNFHQPFKAAFADAKVVVGKDGTVNLTVTAFSLPESQADYDVFIRNDRGTTFLGTLALDPATGGLGISVKPNPELFEKYQFFISLEQKEENKDKHGGFVVLTSKFA